MDFFKQNSKTDQQQTKAVGGGGDGPTKQTPVDDKLVPWVEKYRPKNINEITAQEEVVQVLRKSLETKNLPHLLFYGPPGTGKTSTILALTRDMYGPEAMKHRVLELNASDERGISVVREKIKVFARATVGVTDSNYPSPPYKIIILDEADAMTTDAQAALRRIMEKYARVTRFCLVCNYVSRVIEPLASRCAKFRFRSLAQEEAVGRVREVADKEGVVYEDEAVVRLVDCAGGDLRRAMMSLQSAERVIRGREGGKLTIGMVEELVGVVPNDVINKLKASWSSGGGYTASTRRDLVDELIMDGYPASQVLSQLHDLTMEDPQLGALAKAKIAVLMAQVDKALCDGADEHLQMTNLLMQASVIVAQQT